MGGLLNSMIVMNHHNFHVARHAHGLHVSGTYRPNLTRQQMAQWYDCSREAQWAARPSVVTWNISGHLPISIVTVSNDGKVSQLEQSQQLEEQFSTPRHPKMEQSLEENLLLCESLALAASPLASLPHVNLASELEIINSNLSLSRSHMSHNTPAPRAPFSSLPSVVTWNINGRQLETWNISYSNGRDAVVSQFQEMAGGRVVDIFSDNADKRRRRSEVIEALKEAKKDVESAVVTRIQNLERLAGDNDDKVSLSFEPSFTSYQYVCLICKLSASSSTD
jgi:hypothetical protein